MGYYIDLTKISLDKFKEKLKNEDLLPSQQVLKENIEERFKLIKSKNLKSMEDLKRALKTKKHVERFSLETSLPVVFLTVLRREINSYHPQPRKISDFPEINSLTKKNLEKIGINTTVDLYDKIITKEKRDKLKDQIASSQEEVLLLAKLIDFSRIRYVNQAFATLLINSKYDSIEKIKKADYQELYNQLLKINEEKKLFKGKFGLNDIKFLMREANNIPLEIEL